MQRPQVVGAFVWLGEEVVDGSVVPQPVLPDPAQVEHVGHVAYDASPCRAEPVAHGLQGGGGQVDRGQVGEAAPQEVVDERGRPGPDVDDRGIVVEAGPVDEAEGQPGLRGAAHPRPGGPVAALVDGRTAEVAHPCTVHFW